MIIRIALENNLEGGSIAWALDHPGCFASGDNENQALDRLPVTVQKYVEWIASHDLQPWLEFVPYEFQVEETWQVYSITEHFELAQDGYEVNAWFLNDWKPLTEMEIERGLKLLGWSRLDLLRIVEDLPPRKLDQTYRGERWSIRGIIKHIAMAEWWYLDRLSLAPPRQELPSDEFECLEQVRMSLIKLLPDLVGAHKVVGAEGELWSPRKIIRRAAWHERDHFAHIQRLLRLS